MGLSVTKRNVPSRNQEAAANNREYPSLARGRIDRDAHSEEAPPLVPSTRKIAPVSFRSPLGPTNHPTTTRI